MRKVLILGLILSLLLGCLPAAEADNRVVVNLTRASFNLDTPDPEQVQKVEDAINAYIADKINVEIRLTDICSDNYGETVLKDLESREINLLWTASWEAFIGTNELVQRGLVYDLTDLLSGSQLYTSLAESQWKVTAYNDRNYFIPVFKDNVEGYNIMFREDLVDKYGWDISSVHSLADIEPMLADAKAEGLRYPFLTQKTAMFYRWYIDRFDFFTSDVYTNCFAIDRDTNKVVNTLQTPEYTEFAKLMGRWADLGYISPDDAKRITTDTTTQSHDWAISWWTDIPLNQEATSRYGQKVLMRRVTDRYSHSTSALGSCYCVTANSTPEQARAAVDFMGLMYTDTKLADIYTFGIEGEDFEYTQTPRQEIPHVTQHSTKYNHSMWESASAGIVSPLENEPDYKASLYMDFNGGALTSCASGFRFDKSPVEEKYNACHALFEQYGFVLENGGVPEAEVDARIQEYQAALDDAGYQDVLAEFSRQYEVWKAENPQT